MRWIGTIAREVFGLFVDDGSFAIAILVWLLLAGLCLPWLGVSAGWEGLMLVAGLVFILVESATRRARKSRNG